MLHLYCLPLTLVTEVVRAVVVYIVSQSCNCFYLQQNQQTIDHECHRYAIPTTCSI
jgi:hypothetical protein